MAKRPTYQWVKLKSIDFPSDIEPGVWALAEIWDGRSNGGVYFHGVDHEFSKSDITTFGPIVEPPNGD